MTVRAAWLNPGGSGEGQTREDTRLAPVGTFAPAGALGTRAGALAGGDPFAATGTAAMDLQIGTGRAVVQGTTAQGAYPLALDAPAVISFADGDAQFDRIDSVILRVYDGLYDTSGQTASAVEIVPGSPAASPAAPVLPSPSCLRLWDVTVPAGTSAGVGGISWASALADRRTYTAAHGGVIPQAAASDPGPYDGAYADIGGVLHRWNAAGGTWNIYRAPAEPVETVTSGFDAASGWSLVSFLGRREGRTATVTGYLSRTGADLGGDLNLQDTEIGVLPAGWWPADNVEAVASDGYGDGAAFIGSDGGVRLRTWNSNTVLESGANLRFHGVFIQ